MTRSWFMPFLFIVIWAMSGLASEEKRAAANASVLNAKNKPIRLSSLKNDREVLVLVFVASTCPVTNLYWERIKGAWYNYRDRNAIVVLVGGNSDDSADKIQKILEEREMELPLVWDEKHALARMSGIEFTPEVVVIGKNWEILYRGRIDDSWRDETRIQQRYLDSALTAALSGQKTPDHVDEVFIGSRLR